MLTIYFPIDQLLSVDKLSEDTKKYKEYYIYGFSISIHAVCICYIACSTQILSNKELEIKKWSLIGTLNIHNDINTITFQQKEDEDRTNVIQLYYNDDLKPFATIYNGKILQKNEQMFIYYNTYAINLQAFLQEPIKNTQILKQDVELTTGDQHTSVENTLLPFIYLNSITKAIDTALKWQFPKEMNFVGGLCLQDLSQFIALSCCQILLWSNLPQLTILRWRKLYQGSQLQKNNIFEFLQQLDAILFVGLDFIFGYYITTYGIPHIYNYMSSNSIYASQCLPIIQGHVQWLMGAPAGFKLNLQLTAVMGNGILLCLQLWEYILSLVFNEANGMQIWMYSLKFLSYVGLTIQLSLAADLLNLIVWPLYWISMYFTKLNLIQSRLFSSLLKLFLGKKRNILRLRTDSYIYDVPQLLIGTLLFTILVFTSTTNLVFFIYFAMLKLLVVIVQCCLWGPIVFLRGFPLITILARWVFHLRLFPATSYHIVLMSNDVSFSRLPPSQTIDCNEQTDSRLEKCIDLELVPQPVSYSSLLPQWSTYFGQLRSVYSIGNVWKACIFGWPVPPIPLKYLFPENSY